MIMSSMPIFKRLLAGFATTVVLALVLAAGSPASAKGTGYIFVSNERTNNILVYDPKKDYAQIKDIKTSRRPREIKFNADHTLLYAACGDDDVIDVIDVATLKVVDHIPTARSPEMFVVSRDDKTIYVSNEENSSVQEIDVATKTIVHEVPTGAEPEGVILSEDESILYATSEIADMVHVIDTAQGAVTDNIIVGTRPRRFLLTPDKKFLWVSDELSGQVSIIDRQTNQVVDTLEFLPPGFRQTDVTPVGMALSDDGKTAFISMGRANHVAFVDIATHKVQTYVLVGSRAWNITESPDHKYLYIANGLSDDMSIIDLASKKNIRTIPAGRTPHSVLVDG